MNGTLYFSLIKLHLTKSQQTLPCKSEYNLPQIIRQFSINCFPRIGYRIVKTVPQTTRLRCRQWFNVVCVSISVCGIGAFKMSVPFRGEILA